MNINNFSGCIQAIIVWKQSFYQTQWNRNSQKIYYFLHDIITYLSMMPINLYIENLIIPTPRTTHMSEWVKTLRQQCNVWPLKYDNTHFMCNISMHLNVVLSTHLLHDTFLIIIAERTAKFIIVHSWPVFLNAPTPGHLPPKQNYIVVLGINLSKHFTKNIANSLITSNPSKTHTNERGKSHCHLHFLCPGLLFQPGVQ